MVSIIIPVYNSQDYIGKTLNSCINQSVSNIEIIVVDDCSIDKSEQIIKKYQKNYNNIKLIKNEKNYGFIKSVNIGIQESKYDYLIILGNDDILSHDHVEIMSNIIIEKKCSFVYCASDFIDTNDNVFATSKTIDINKNIKLMARNNYVNSCGLIISKKDLLTIGGYPFFEKFPNYGEWYLWISLILINGGIFTKEVKSLYRIHSNNLTKTFNKKENLKKIRDYNMICMNYAIEKLPLKKSEKFMCIIRKYLKKLKYNIQIYS